MSKKKFKVGDKVRIRTWKKMKKEFGIRNGEIDCSASFTKPMKYLCEAEFTIKRIRFDPDGVLYVKRIDCFYITPDMIERVK